MPAPGPDLPPELMLGDIRRAAEVQGYAPEELSAACGGSPTPAALKHYLDGRGGLTGAELRALFRALGLSAPGDRYPPGRTRAQRRTATAAPTQGTAMDERDKAPFASLLASLHSLGVVPEAEFDSLAVGHLRVGGYPDPSAKWAEFKALMLDHGRALRFELAGSPHLVRLRVAGVVGGAPAVSVHDVAQLVERMVVAAESARHKLPKPGRQG